MTDAGTTILLTAIMGGAIAYLVLNVVFLVLNMHWDKKAKERRRLGLD